MTRTLRFRYLMFKGGQEHCRQGVNFEGNVLLLTLSFISCTQQLSNHSSDSAAVTHTVTLDFQCTVNLVLT
jgi:hypothetical protein